ncbi:hypothetical protein [Solibacillus sp. CAU 1738]|uniref:hypothetical protein n=1 Tax=Solibacillus sp. CAU 1738 TaxID=3140363 RepID=UPI0032610180
MRKWLFVFSALLLAACTDENVVNSEKEAQEDKLLPQSEDEWLTFAQNSNWFEQTIQNQQIVFEEMVDFQGDDEPEYIVATEQDAQNVTLTIAQFNDGQWQKWYEQTYTSETFSELTSYGTLAFNNEKDLLVISHKTAEALEVNETITFFVTNAASDRIVKGYTLNIKNDDLFSLTADGFIVNDGNYTRTVKIDNGFIVEDYYRQAFADGEPIVSDDLAHLFGKSLNDTKITFEHTYYEAQQKAGTPEQEDYVEGSLCSLYKDYFFCLNDNAPQIAFATIFVNGVTLQEVEDIIGQPLTIESYESDMNGSPTEYFTQFAYNNRFYSLTLDGSLHTSEIVEAHVSTIEYTY